MKTITTSFIRVNQPIGEFYCCVMKAKDLYEISYTDVRRMANDEKNKDGFDTYLGIQRELSTSRVKKIKEYIHSVDATFPNSIIVAIDQSYISISSDNKMTIEFDESKSGKIAKILDGQHRLAGFEDSNFTYYNDENKQVDFELLVTIFISADLHTQAQVFTMVNQNQTKVNRSLVYDLESLALARSPTKTAHQIAVLLNERPNSPFYHRIKRLGFKTPGITTELLTQAAFVKNLVKLISQKPNLDRDILLGKKKGFLGVKNTKLPDNNSKIFKQCVFRKCFIKEDDSTIAIILYNYFNVISQKWPESWNSSNDMSVLNKTVGLSALMRFLKLLINHLVSNKEYEFGEIITKDTFEKLICSINIESSFFSEIQPVSKSEGYIYKCLKEKFEEMQPHL